MATDNIYKTTKNIFLSLPEAAKRLKCTVEDLQERGLCEHTSIFAQAITNIFEGLDGSERIQAPVFAISTGQLKKILDNNGASIDPNADINPFLWAFPPTQVRVEVKDLRVVLPSWNLSESDNSNNPDKTMQTVVDNGESLAPGQLNSSDKLDVNTYLEQHKDAPVAEKAYWLRTNTTFTANKIGELLRISHNTPGCKSRKVTVGKVIKIEALRLGTWEQVKRKNGK